MVSTEEENFALFNYVNGLRNEIEKIDERCEKIRNEINTQNNQLTHSITRLNRHQQMTNKNSYAEINANNKIDEEVNEYYDISKSVMETIKKSISEIFNKLKCKKEDIENSHMSENVFITDQNLMQYVGAIERKTKELLQEYILSEVNNGKKHEKYKEILLPDVKLPKKKLSIDPPSAMIVDVDVEEGDDALEAIDEEQPITREKIMESMMLKASLQEIIE